MSDCDWAPPLDDNGNYVTASLADMDGRVFRVAVDPARDDVLPLVAPDGELWWVASPGASLGVAFRGEDD